MSKSRGFEKLMAGMEKHLLPMADKLGNIKYLAAVRDGMINAMPFLIVGSLLLLLLNIPVTDPESVIYVEWYANLMATHKAKWLQPFYASLGMASIFISFGIGSNLAKLYKLPTTPGGFLAMFAFFIVAAPVDGWPPMVQARFLDTNGMFTAIVFSIFAVEVYRFMTSKGMTIRLPEQVPPAIARSFEALTPVIALMLILQPMNLFVASLGEGGMLIPELVTKLFAPMVSAIDTLPGLLMLVFGFHILWFFGMHGTNILGGIAAPVALANFQANNAAFVAGVAAPTIYAGSFLDMFVMIGGIGSTLGLAIAMSLSKNAHLKSIGRISIAPGIFQINEPVMFGTPIVMNPILGIPFLVVPLVSTVIAYFAAYHNLVGRVVTLVPWTTPAPVSALLATNFSLTALILSLFLLAFSTLAYMPFLKMYAKTLEADQKQEEVNAIESSEPATA
ncbi:PTS transporter subunit EIIC [Endozoicomonas gorgoniicola]|uniref:Permease IIC component n=1 Tax=Endozoicomonas gorgoniicola TaxID=1234144 RepID=A0ABT3MYL1_9GAMM|nr:PTS transporter subunit EIIC [Endozoicomonas gorgoniicola]MCW7554466.1 PTS transporter subunit EIIC [Endozoicomonas gorgoniicola]